MKIILLFSLFIFGVWECYLQPKEILEEVTEASFRKFCEETGYITSAELAGYSYEMITVDSFVEVELLCYKLGNFTNPVVHVSQIDAEAFCKWEGSHLPTYEEYYRLIDTTETINISGTKILPSNQVSVKGNVWDITASKLSDLPTDDFPKTMKGLTVIMGGSYMCSKTSCGKYAYTDYRLILPITRSSNIGFARVVTLK